MNCYTYIKQIASINVGVAFLFLCLFFSNSFSLSLSPVFSESYTGVCIPNFSGSPYSCTYSVADGNINACAHTSCLSIALPEGASVVSATATGFVSSSVPSGSYLATASGVPPVSMVSNWVCSCPSGGCNSGAGLTKVSCFFNFTLSSGNSLPSCAAPAPVSALQCKGGKGLLTTVSGALGTQNLLDAYGDSDFYRFIGGVNYWHWNGNAVGATAHATTSNIVVNSDSTKYTAVRPDGSQCDLFFSGLGRMYDFVTCPLGLNLDGLFSSSSEQGISSEATSSSSSDGYSSGGGQSSNDGGTTGGNGEGSTTCLTNNNCNWARIDVQLTQLGVETQTRDYVRDIAALQSAGYNLTSEQNILLHSVLQAVNSGNANVVGALNGLASAVNAGNSANSDNFNSSLTSWQDMMNNAFGVNGSKIDNIGSGVADGVAGGLGKFAGDTAGTDEFNNSLSEYGNGAGSAMGDSLGNGTVARNKVKQAIKIDSTSFSFLGSSGSCPVWDLSFNAGIVSCNSCKIDLCNVYGFNAGQVIRAIIWLIALVSVLFMNLQVLKTGGH